MDSFSTKRTLAICIGFMVMALPLIWHVSSAANKTSKIKIEVHNPYTISLKIDSKCDYNEETEDFNYAGQFILKAKKTSFIVMPHWVRHCQFWPSIHWEQDQPKPPAPKESNVDERRHHPRCQSNSCGWAD